MMGEEAVDQELQLLRDENKQLLRSVQNLKELLAQTPGTVVQCGDLYEYKPVAPFLEKPWELRFFSLTSKTLSFWKSEAEAAGSHPQGRYSLDNWVIRLTELRDGKYVVFTIEDSAGDLLMRLSGGPGVEARRWVNALQLLGCKIVPELSTWESDLSSEITSTQEINESEDDASDKASGLRQRKGAVTKQSGPLQKQAVTPQSDDSSSMQNSGRSEAVVKYDLRPSSLAHKRLKDSPLSSDAIFKQSHAGLFNLCIVVLLAVNSRLIIENIMKYGLLIQSGFWFSPKSAKDWPLLMCGLTLSICPLLAYLTEKLRAHSYISERALVFMHIINCTVEIAYPMYVVGRGHSELLPGVILMEIAITGWLKLVSYAHANADLRLLALSGKKPETPMNVSLIEYPQNITLANMAYFIVAPTLCYQPSYPRSSTLRKGWVLRQVVKLIVFTSLMGFIVEQYINPIIKSSQHPLKGNYLYAIERVLKLSIPVLYVWLCMFYTFFHLWFNIVAEITFFGDREFYKDWWNAKTVDEYWRMWNMPVHRWLVRHVYFPCIRHGASKHMASIATFAVSAIFHEICIGTPCHMLRAWAFLGMMLQVPLVVLTNWLQRKFQSSIVGNMIFWFFFCIVGQPMCILLYYHDLVQQQQVPTAT
ncbi:hypothetical protein O6H91_21G017500 [Diphasiastrum complanatum]|uniref:Uncharacterized protein n=5 Tax=Diphasiastrum complanatum TaxID=34168 RepID=A0ACC2AIE7_DIPCM|nr:hypothetical protein O6H91_21G017500 [Diphasiastrum complanatum]KAJ7517297.1 hypothetical protein O6H91_21G017500 [Diphasiastrum complanatum]KAJ7517298.1 hypothetical protein O6H91_21G017500 [Diphasiastrum complanatum]KAJ7517299.1 hypothetical protein O6H91_21G017500 [Diphasiastrum complanatum]KAJ7517300.1 hypothetical protein O6H91_21G017500 [Diphasiastrum complanatum]